MENSLLFIFGEIWPETMYYSTGTLTRFLSNFKIHKKSNFDWICSKSIKYHIYSIYSIPRNCVVILKLLKSPKSITQTLLAGEGRPLTR